MPLVNYFEMNNQIAGFICLIIGAASGAYFAWTLYRFMRVSNWFVTKGTVVESKLLPVSDSFEPYVKYQYMVRGKNFTHDKFKNFNIICEYEYLAMKHLEPYPIGKTVKVYFDPKNPQNSVLEKREAIHQYVFWVMFSLFFIFCGISLLLQT